MKTLIIIGLFLATMVVYGDAIPRGRSYDEDTLGMNNYADSPQMMDEYEHGNCHCPAGKIQFKVRKITLEQRYFLT